MNASRQFTSCACLLIGFLLINGTLYGQQAIFSGGRGDGYSKNGYSQSQPSGYQLFKGGLGDGHSSTEFMQSVVLDYQLFMAGVGDGYASAEYLQTSPLGTEVFYGGIGDGASESSYEQDLTITFGVYTGGDGDGYTSAEYAQGTTNGYDLFRGGTNDGHASMSYQQQQVTGYALFAGGLGDGHAMNEYNQESSVSTILFLGGQGDGYDQDDFLQTIPIGSELYAGGAGDGADQDDYEQGVVAVFGVYTGGEGDGFDLAEYQQTDFIDALPVELLSFIAELTGVQVALSWSTATETNNDYFLVQRSNDLKRWTSIDSVRGAGNSNQLIEYQSTDTNPKTKINYYRLLQVDYDGTTSYSMIRTVDLSGVKATAELIVYPNPVRDRINLQFTGFVGNEVQIRIYDANGRQVYDKKLILAVGQGVYEINRSTQMLEGYYVVIVTDEFDGQSMKTRMLVK